MTNTPEMMWRYVAVADADDCWLWQGSTDMRYGTFRIGRKMVKAHRLAYEQTHGPIPRGYEVCHRCDTTLCVNPQHLFIGTHADNMRDRNEKGRLAYGERMGIARLKDADVRRIRQLAAEGTLQREIASLFGIDSGHVSKIVNRRAWRRLP
jgi:hypothetical protein